MTCDVVSNGDRPVATPRASASSDGSAGGVPSVSRQLPLVAKQDIPLFCRAFPAQLPWCLDFENLVCVAITFDLCHTGPPPRGILGAGFGDLAVSGSLGRVDSDHTGCLSLRSGVDNCVACVASLAQGTMSQVTCCRARPQPGRPSYCAWYSLGRITW